jgi:hypothetical protein
VVQKLVEAGIHGLAHLAETSDEELGALEGIGPKTVEKLREAAALAQKEWDERDAAAETERLAAEQAAADQAAADQAAAEQAAADQAAADQAAAASAAGATAGAEATAETAAATAESGVEEGGTDGER